MPTKRKKAIFIYFLTFCACFSCLRGGNSYSYCRQCTYHAVTKMELQLRIHSMPDRTFKLTRVTNLRKNCDIYVVLSLITCPITSLKLNFATLLSFKSSRRVLLKPWCQSEETASVGREREREFSFFPFYKRGPTFEEERALQRLHTFFFSLSLSLCCTQRLRARCF